MIEQFNQAYTDMISRALEIRPELTRYLSARTRDSHLAEDLVQETYLHFLQAQDRYDPQKSPIGIWLRRIGHNLLIDELRRRSRRKTTEFTAEHDREFEEAMGVVDSRLDAKEIVDKILPQLNEGQREIIQMRAQGKTFNEIAKELNKPSGTVKTKYHRARKKAERIVTTLELDSSLI